MTPTGGAGSPRRVPTQLLTSTTNSFEAKVIAARLVAEGLQPELRGAVDGPYPFLVGGMAEVGIWVPEDQMDDASLVLLAAEVDDAVASRPRERPRWTLGAAVVAAAVLVTLVLTFLARILGTAS